MRTPRRYHAFTAMPKSSPAEALAGEASSVSYLAFLHLGVVCLLPQYRPCLGACIPHLPSFFASVELVLAQALVSKPGDEQTAILFSKKSLRILKRKPF